MNEHLARCRRNVQHVALVRWLQGLLLAIAWIGGSAHSQSNPVAEAQEHLREASAAYRAGDAHGFTQALETAYRLNPASIYTRYNLARGYVATEQPNKAMELLRALVDARIDSGMANDPDLEPLRNNPEFRQLLKRLDGALKPNVTSTPYLTVDLLGLIPEGIAYDPATQRFFFSSMRSGDVHVLDAQLQLSRFATLDAQRRLSAIGMTVDSDRQRLWVVGAPFEMAEGYAEDTALTSGIFAIDLATGSIANSYQLDEADTGLNDVALGPDGRVYASGTILHVLDEEAGRLKPFRTTPELYGSNGIAVDSKGETLFVSSYPVGLAAIDLDSGALTFLDAPGNISLYGIDGLYWHRGDLIGIQNGIRPWRLLRLSLNNEGTRVTATKHLEFASEATTPTTGAIIDDQIFYIGQGPQPVELPSHFPEELAPFMGKTLIRRAPIQ